MRHIGGFDMTDRMNNLNSILFNIAQSLPGLLLAIVVHEAAHAWMADKFGDPTAKNEGRLTLNPVVHYDPLGTIFFPLLGAVLGWGVIGWARPVPIEVRNFKNIRKGIFWVSFAGPLSNLLLGTFLALIFGLVVTRVSPEWGYHTVALKMLNYAIYINFLLAFFNLIPFPPLDGSKMVSSFLKGPTLYKYESLARYTPAVFMLVFLLSFLNIPTISYLLMPGQWLAQQIVFLFITLFGSL